MKEVVILGGGFAGISAAIIFKNKIKDDNLNVTLINKNNYHLFHASLYEVATSEQPKKNIAIPICEILGKEINFVKGEIVNIDIENHLVQLATEVNYYYDYLIVALGSEHNYNIQGLKEYSIPLKTLDDAILIRDTIKNVFLEKVTKGKQINIVVGGGGFSGCELTGELVNYRRHLSIKYKTSENLFKISIIQGSNRLLKDLDNNVSDIVIKRLEQNNVQIYSDTHINGVSKDYIMTNLGKNFPFDVFIWTGGVRANSILVKSGFKVNNKNQISINNFLQINNFKNIFAVGDIAEFADPLTNKPVPGVAEVAIDQGKIAAQNVYKSFKNEDLLTYTYSHLGYIIPIKGHYAIADLNKFKLIGFWGFVLQQLVFLYYLLEILPVFKAIKRWNKAEFNLIKTV